MNETASTKPRVTILSDIVLNPYRDIPQSENPPASSPPLAPLSNQNQIVLGITNGPNISDSSESTNKQTVPSTPDTEITKIHTIDASLKRKSGDIDIAYRETPKKPKLKAINVQSPIRDQVDLNEEDGEETVFNYMTGAYETVTRVETPKSLESPKKDDDIKNEITIQENILKDEDMSPKIEAEDSKIDDTKQEIESVTRFEQGQVPALDDKKPTLTIDLTDDDDDNVPNIGVQNNVFIHNVQTLQNAVALQNWVKSLDSKTLLQNSFVIQKRNSPSTNLHGKGMMKNVNLTLQNSAKISTQDTSKKVSAAGTFTPPTVFVVQNNSTFLVPQNPTSPNKPVHNNLRQNLVLLPNNSNIQSKQSSSVPNNVQTNLSPVKNIESFALKNNSVNLGAVEAETDKILLSSFTTATPVQIEEKLPSSSLDKTASDNSAHNSPDSAQNLTNSPQNLKNSVISSQNLTTALQNFTCSTCAHKACSKTALILHIYNAHLKNDYELNLKCKICGFETASQSNMEKHDFGYGCNSKNQENLGEVILSSNVEIRVRLAEKEDDSVSTSFVHIDLSDSDDPISKETPNGSMIVRCFECEFVSSKKQYLTGHAKKHMPSKFQCPKHATLMKFCPECEYKSCLLRLETNPGSNNKNNSKNQENLGEVSLSSNVETQVRLAKKKDDSVSPSFVHIDLSDSENPVSKETPNGRMKVRCFECEFVSSQKQYLTSHAVKHMPSNFQCPKHATLMESCPECVYKSCLLHLEKNPRSNNKNNSKNQENLGKVNLSNKKPNGRMKVRCFECKFVSSKKKYLTGHAKMHMPSKFQCPKHATLMEFCPECEYKRCLLRLEENPRSNNKNNSKNHENLAEVSLSSNEIQVRLAKEKDDSVSPSSVHIDLSDSEDPVSKETPNGNTTVRCFECKYVGSQKQYLTSHAVIHMPSKFQCPKHATLVESCPECEYKSCLLHLEKNPRSNIRNNSKNQENLGEVSLNSNVETRVQLTKKKDDSVSTSFVHVDLSDSEDPVSKKAPNGNMTVRCFECKFVSTKKKYLTGHAKKHMPSKFQCPKHATLMESCPECEYKSCLLRLEKNSRSNNKNNSKNQENLVEVSLNSNVETRVQLTKKKDDSVSPSFVHVDLSDSEDPISKKAPNGNMTVRCFECTFVSTKKKYLTGHAKKHMPSKFQCPKHATLRESCPECEYKSCLLRLEKTPRYNNKEPRANNTNKKDSEIFKCFHCFHVSKSLSLLKYHAVRHFGGGFMCDIHKFVNSATCNKCIYEMVLRDLKYVVNACPCGYKTLNKDYYLKHTSTEKNCEAFRKTIGNCAESSSGFLAEIEKEFQKSEKTHGSNKRWPVIGINVSRNSGMGKGKASRIQELSSDSDIEEVSGNFRCFHCTYTTTSRDLLKYHAVKHYPRAFQCNLHLTLKEDACDQCLYSVIREELGKEVLLCLECGFRTLRQPTFDRHKSTKENCEKYRKSLAKDLEKPVESESDAETRSTKSSKGSLSSATTQERNSPVLRAEVLICATCNYIAKDKDTFKLHEKVHENPSSKPKPLLNCFDCNEFCTEDREELKKHSVLHYKKNFSCQKHCPTENVLNCGKCIYLSIKKDMDKEIMICKKCSFKTLRPDLFEQHKSSENLCRTSTKDTDDDYVPESDADSGKESGEENPRRKREHLSASNGDTVAPKKTFYNFQCFDCGLQYVNQSALEMHVVAHPDSSFRCDHVAFDELCKKCIYQFILEKTSGKKMLSCKSCSYKCNDLEAMRNHIKSHVDCENVSENSPVSNNPPSGLKSCHCYDCGMEFDSRTKLWTHATRHKSDFRCLEHAGSMRNDCNKCLYSFIQKNIRPYYFKCFDCPNRSYFSELDLKGHIELNHEGSKFKCDEHRVPRPTSCEKCRYVYMVTQTSKKIKYICVDCKNNLPFPTWRSLKDHISYCHAHSGTKCLNHTTIKQYLSCDSCLFEKIMLYLQSQGLKNGYQCFECPVKMFTRENLEVHVRIMHEDSTFHCTTHSLGDIDDQCGMCVYESVVVLINS